MKAGAARLQVKAELPVLGCGGVWCGLLVADADKGGWWIVTASWVLAGGTETKDKPVGMCGKFV